MPKFAGGHPVRSLAATSLILGLLASSIAAAHSRLLPAGIIPPRSTNSGIKTGPCGGLPRVTPKVLQMGSSVLVEWEETINHPGYFMISFSQAGDTNFQLLATIQATQNDPIGAVTHKYSATVQLPAVTCDACTIQLIQVMTENPAAPTNYYSCGDIQLVANPMTVTTTTLPVGSPTASTTTTTIPPLDPTSCH